VPGDALNQCAERGDDRDRAKPIFRDLLFNDTGSDDTEIVGEAGI